mmetsp:Transcript_30585/g.79418  ORF Transcript_30585/g.79418 Transcript_30585/m.79418 type:complete len:105 (-) Transcript_30585:301-615(-)
MSTRFMPRSLARIQAALSPTLRQKMMTHRVARLSMSVRAASTGSVMRPYSSLLLLAVFTRRREVPCDRTILESCTRLSMLMLPCKPSSPPYIYMFDTLCDECHV